MPRPGYRHLCAAPKPQEVEASWRRRKQEAIPKKHVGLLIKAIADLGLYPKSMHEKSSGAAGQDGEEYNVFIAVEETSPPYLHLG